MTNDGIQFQSPLDQGFLWSRVIEDKAPSAHDHPANKQAGSGCVSEGRGGRNGCQHRAGQRQRALNCGVKAGVVRCLVGDAHRHAVCLPTATSA